MGVPLRKYINIHTNNFHYNPSIWITISFPKLCMQPHVDSERQLENIFFAFWFILRSFAKRLLKESQWKNMFLGFVCFLLCRLGFGLGTYVLFGQHTSYSAIVASILQVSSFNRAKSNNCCSYILVIYRNCRRWCIFCQVLKRFFNGVFS